jgi:hypothetical protein
MKIFFTSVFLQANKDLFESPGLLAKSVSKIYSFCMEIKCKTFRIFRAAKPVYKKGKNLIIRIKVTIAKYFYLNQKASRNPVRGGDY